MSGEIDPRMNADLTEADMVLLKEMQAEKKTPDLTPFIRQTVAANNIVTRAISFREALLSGVSLGVITLAMERQDYERGRSLFSRV